MMKLLELLQSFKFKQKYTIQLIQENNRLSQQLHEANKIIAFYGSLQDEIIENGSVELRNVNMANSYLCRYCIPTNIPTKEEINGTRNA